LTDEKFRDQVSSNVNWIVGITEKEGLLIHAGVILNEKSERGKKIRESLNSDRETVYPVTLAYEHTVPRHYWRSVSDDVHKFYFGDKQIGLKTPEETINLYSDRFFNHGIRNSAKLFAKFGGKVFLYKFTYKGKFSFSELFEANPGYHAVTHLDDLTYQFNMTFSTQVVPEFDENKEMMQISKDFLELWISFAKTGTPEILSEERSEKWTPVSKDEEEPQWYVIDKERKFSTNDPSFTARMKFWDTLPKLREMEREKLENTRTEL
jgi:carboxylesterase type B